MVRQGSRTHPARAALRRFESPFTPGEAAYTGGTDELTGVSMMLSPSILAALLIAAGPLTKAATAARSAGPKPTCGDCGEKGGLFRLDVFNDGRYLTIKPRTFAGPQSDGSTIPAQDFVTVLTVRLRTYTLTI